MQYPPLACDEIAQQKRHNKLTRAQLKIKGVFHITSHALY